MHYDMMRDKAKEMPILEAPLEIDSLRIWHCKYKSFEPISAYKNLRSLRIATYPDNSLEYLYELSKLEHLSIVHLPKVTDLRPLISMKDLRSLYLETLPSWDASRKRTIVNSLKPLAELPKLEHVSLLGVITSDKLLTDLWACEKLKSGKFLGYRKEEIEKIYSEKRLECSHGPFC